MGSFVNEITGAIVRNEQRKMAARSLQILFQCIFVSLEMEKKQCLSCPYFARRLCQTCESWRKTIIVKVVEFVKHYKFDTETFPLTLHQFGIIYLSMTVYSGSQIIESLETARIVVDRNSDIDRSFFVTCPGKCSIYSEKNYQDNIWEKRIIGSGKTILSNEWIKMNIRIFNHKSNVIKCLLAKYYNCAH